MIASTAEEKWWERHYARGGRSGHGSVGEHRKWKWGIIEEYVSEVDHVIDVGCGDLTFWEDRDCNDYIGIDFSNTIIERDRKARPHWKFILRHAEDRIDGLRAPVVFCFDVLIHQMDEAVFMKILENLCHYSTALILLYNWIKPKPGRGVTDGIIHYFRPLEKYMNIFERGGFKLIDRRGGDPGDHNKRGAIYVFKREEKR